MTGLLATLLFFGDVHYRWIGPAVMGGRLDAAAGVPGHPKIVYLGHSSGGLWKSNDGGLTFASVFEAGSSSAVGTITIDPRDANRIYIGTGEPFPRNTADAGDGIWTSPDAGKHWQHLGLDRSSSIARIAVDPANRNVMLAAAMGSEFAPGGDRGIYRSDDRGAHWRRVLYGNETTGGSDVAFDPANPSIVYAGLYDFARKPWTFRSGGPGSGLYRSSDGGRSWTRLTSAGLHNGLPSRDIDRVGVSVCASDPHVVYAFVPSKAGYLYRSVDGGAHWALRNRSESIDFRPFYFSQVRCDPHDPRKVYALASGVNVSTDGGLKFHDMPGAGGDNHDLWIDPQDSSRLLNASDVGFDYSLTGGRTWNYDDVVPFAQVYHAGFDFDEPYHVMGGLQDHEVWWGPNELLNANDGASNGDWLNISDWGDGQYAVADPRDPAIVYEDTHFGDLARLDMRTQQRRYISPRPVIPFGAPASAAKFRFSWSAPLLLSKFDSSVLYFGANVLFRSPDGGDSWLQYSPDLTQCSAQWLRASGGPVALDNTNAETYCTITSIAEDAADAGTVWYGTDNGHVEITTDNGRSWNEAETRINVPPGSRVTCVETSHSQPAVAYVAFDRHEYGDDAPYVFMTRDRGRTWQAIGYGLTGYVHAVREDPRNPDVLYAGTERGIFVSFDRGAHWTDFRLGLPHLPVYDIQIQPRDNDLIVATHGRGFYILDDLTPVQQYAAQSGRAAYLFAPMPAIRYSTASFHEHGRGAFIADNKPYGALLSLYLAAAPPDRAGKPHVAVHVSSQGKTIDTFTVRVHAGLNRFSWDLSTQAPGPAQDPRPYYVFYPVAIAGPQVVPGTYTVSVDLPGERIGVPVTVVLNPHESATPEQLQMQYDALERLAAIQERAEEAIAQLGALQKKEGVRPQTTALLDRLRNPESSGYRSGARLSEQIAYLRYVIAQYDGPPTAAQLALIAEYSQEMDAVDGDMAAVMRSHPVHEKL
ncbi:MAG TPA: hypothetical protein VGZ02_05665 [Candidatus Baltobacteraceae bacterium]|nr:hypothetical protein [Candidatus Baltobacteraceae bacterium]